MEQQKLPNSTLILVFGILSLVLCCCSGFIGIIFGIIAVIMAKKATDVYMANPELYTGFQNVKTGRLLGIIGIVLNGLSIIFAIYILATDGMEGIFDMYNEILDQYR